MSASSSDFFMIYKFLPEKLKINLNTSGPYFASEKSQFRFPTAVTSTAPNFLFVQYLVNDVTSTGAYSRAGGKHEAKQKICYQTQSGELTTLSLTASFPPSSPPTLIADIGECLATLILIFFFECEVLLNTFVLLLVDNTSSSMRILRLQPYQLCTSNIVLLRAAVGLVLKTPQLGLGMEEGDEFLMKKEIDWKNAIIGSMIDEDLSAGSSISRVSAVLVCVEQIVQTLELQTCEADLVIGRGGERLEESGRNDGGMDMEGYVIGVEEKDLVELSPEFGFPQDTCVLLPSSNCYSALRHVSERFTSALEVAFIIFDTFSVLLHCKENEVFWTMTITSLLSVTNQFVQVSEVTAPYVLH